MDDPDWIKRKKRFSDNDLKDFLRRRQMKKDTMQITLTVVFILLVILLPAGCAYGTKETVSFTVNKSERVTTGSGDSLSSKYLIFTEGEVYENSDTLWYMKWNSSDIYSQIKEGQSYKADVYGFRIPFLSMYRNVIELRPNHDQ